MKEHRNPKPPSATLALQWAFRLILGITLGAVLSSCCGLTQPIFALKPTNTLTPTRTSRPSRTSTPTRTRTPSPTFTPFMTATPNLKTFLPIAGELCDALFSQATIKEDYLNFPPLILLKSTYATQPAWAIRTSSKVPHQDFLLSSQDLVVCIQQGRSKAGSYTDGQPGYRITWNVMAISRKDQKTAQTKLSGGSPPFIKTGSGPAYGSAPTSGLGIWLGQTFPVADLFFTDTKLLTGTYLNDSGIRAIEFATNVKFWDVARGIKLADCKQNDVTSVKIAAISADGTAVAFAGATKSIMLWDPQTGNKVTLTSHTELPKSLAFSDDGKMLASAGMDGLVKLWDTATGKEMASLGVQEVGKSTDPYSVTFSPDGQLLAASTGKSGITIWEVAGGMTVEKIESPNGATSLVFSPDGKILASANATQKGSIELWDVATWKNLSANQTDSISALAFSPDGKTLAAATSKYEILRMDVQSGQISQGMHSHTSTITSLAWSPDGKTLASFSNDGSARLWDMADIP
jgi:sugar lactone lactonase YvrE